MTVVADDEALRSEDVLSRLREFILERVLKDSSAELEARTPLLEWGILNSLSTAELIAFIRSEFGIFVPPEAIFGANFKNLNAITVLVISLSSDPGARA